MNVIYYLAGIAIAFWICTKALAAMQLPPPVNRGALFVVGAVAFVLAALVLALFFRHVLP